MLKNFLNDNIDENFQNHYEVLIKIVFDFQLKHCENCGKLMSYQKSKGKNKYCSNLCSLTSKDRLEKVKQTCLEKYGVENISQLDLIKKKKEETCLKHYGTKRGKYNEKFYKNL